MTREEHIEILKQYREKPTLINEISSVEEAAWLDESLGAAIKVLEQEPCEDCISRAEAIKALGYDLSIEVDGGFDGYRTVIKKMLNAINNTQKKAIEDLPGVQPKQIECGDTISRKWIKEAIHNFYQGLNHVPTEEDIQRYIEVAPSVNPQPKTGHWIEKDVVLQEDNAIDEWQSARCDKCGKYHTTPYMYYFSHYEYCPNCGAKMEG